MGTNSKQQKEEQLQELRRRREQEAREKQQRQNRMIWTITGCVLAVILLAAGIVALVNHLGEDKPAADTTNEPVIDATNADYVATEEVTDYVRFTITYTDQNGVYRQGEIIAHLRADVAPQTVANFQSLVKSDFYNGLTFHRVISDFMIQGGAPKGDGTGGSKQDIVGEFSSNGYNNPLEHKRGVLSMARSDDPNSASSQFFIVREDSHHLDGDYAAFGEVVSGMATVDGIADTKVRGSKPVNPVIILNAEFVQPKQ